MHLMSQVHVLRETLHQLKHRINHYDDLGETTDKEELIEKAKAAADELQEKIRHHMHESSKLRKGI